MEKSRKGLEFEQDRKKNKRDGGGKEWGLGMEIDREFGRGLENELGIGDEVDPQYREHKEYREYKDYRYHPATQNPKTPKSELKNFQQKKYHLHKFSNKK